ncbi:hypothetical protein B5807_06254 [Epicoccum nigrum]|uniref:Uncharacterized protein n=1 Tax=Epicoccum nigrum TaxID=105696 RepID=A0A1Y2M1X7_EPING|nr:hypothetical protein B5807_06254 [Epicoccum nigrum]
MTMPAMAPLESPELDFVVSSVAPEEVEVGEADADADAEGVDDAVEAVVVGVAAEEAMDVELMVAELTELESEPPSTWARCTMPTLEVQQSVDEPQHHRSLVAVPSQGVMGVFPTTFLVCWQTFRHSVAVTSLLVQKSTHWDGSALLWYLDLVYTHV